MKSDHQQIVEYLEAKGAGGWRVGIDATEALRKINMKPVRIQMSRAKGWRLPANTVYVGRPSRYGNPHLVGYCPACGVEHTRDEAVDEFEAMLTDIPAYKVECLRGKNLACWCRPGERCHADVLLRKANS